MGHIVKQIEDMRPDDATETENNIWDCMIIIAENLEDAESQASQVDAVAKNPT